MLRCGEPIANCAFPATANIFRRKSGRRLYRCRATAPPAVPLWVVAECFRCSTACAACTCSRLNMYGPYDPPDPTKPTPQRPDFKVRRSKCSTSLSLACKNGPAGARMALSPPTLPAWCGGAVRSPDRPGSGAPPTRVQNAGLSVKQLVKSFRLSLTTTASWWTAACPTARSFRYIERMER
jgi:hypothetical protein